MKAAIKALAKSTAGKRSAAATLPDIPPAPKEHGTVPFMKGKILVHMANESYRVHWDAANARDRKVLWKSFKTRKEAWAHACQIIVDYAETGEVPPKKQR